MTLYDLLGVRPGATAAEIRTAYLAAARRAHPDVAGPSGDDTMRDLNSAWAVLGDAEARERYDLTLAAGPSAPGRPAEGPGGVLSSRVLLAAAEGGVGAPAARRNTRALRHSRASMALMM